MALQEFLNALRQDEVLVSRVEQCDSVEELFQVAKEYQVTREELQNMEKFIELTEE